MATGKEVAVLSKEIGAIVMGRVTELVEAKQLTTPEGYDVGTAINMALLILQDTKDRNGRPVLEVCTKSTIAKTILDMVIQGLQPGKKQCYFIAYADQLTLFRSYFGTVAALKRAMPEVAHVTAEVFYNGDELVYGITPFGERYVKYIGSEPLVNINQGIKGGFCTIYDAKGNVLGSTIMTWEDIQTSWKQSRNYKAEGGVHQKFTSEMAKRTLIAKACKFLLNTSGDKAGNAAVIKSFNDTTDSEFGMEVQNEIKPEQKKVTFKERYSIPEKTEKESTTSAEKPSEKEESNVAEEKAASPEEKVSGPEASDDEPFGDVTPEDGLFDGMDDVGF